MGRFKYILRDVQQVLFPDRGQHPIPAMDGGLAPNDELDGLAPLGAPIPNVDDCAEGSDGSLYVSAGHQILRLAGDGYENRSVAADLDGRAGGVAFHPDGRVLVCVADRGLLAIDRSGRRQWLTEVEAQPLKHLTSVAASPNGAVFMCEGSSQVHPDEWSRDLMQKNRLGRLISCGPGLNGAKVLLRDMYFPYGVALAPDAKSLWFTESWIHRVSRAPLAGREISAPEVVVDNLPGYPARIGDNGGDGFWISVFAPRTHLVEFVLQEDEFREAMMKTIPQPYWVAPSLMSTDHVLDPAQNGNIKALGIQKPWAPPRSYGLIVHINETGDILESMHSRVGGLHHGVTSARRTAQGLVVVSKGAGRVLFQPNGGSR
jgi:Strictosidine synthase